MATDINRSKRTILPLGRVAYAIISCHNTNIKMKVLTILILILTYQNIFCQLAID